MMMNLITLLMCILMFYFWQWTGIGGEVVVNPKAIDVADFSAGFLACAIYDWLRTT